MGKFICFFMLAYVCTYLLCNILYIHSLIRLVFSAKLQIKHAHRWMLGSFILLYAVLTLYGSYLMYTDVEQESPR